MTCAEAGSVDGKDNIASTDEIGAKLDGRVLALEELDLPAIEFADVPMAVEGRG